MTSADDFATRFTAELARQAEGRLSAVQAEKLSRMSEDELVQRVAAGLNWLDPGSIKLLASRGPEELARGMIREQIRETGEPRGLADRCWWVAGLLDLLHVAEL